ncbi:MAG: hypothetical protein WBP69_07985 [Terriglobales bacterium]
MNKLLIPFLAILTAAVIVLLLLGHVPTFQSGFTDAQIQAVELTIKDYFVQHMQNSPSAVEREQIANGSTTVEVHMIKMSARRLEGFAVISLRDKESTALGLGDLRVACEATMGENSDQWLWKCQNK